MNIVHLMALHEVSDLIENYFNSDALGDEISDLSHRIHQICDSTTERAELVNQKFSTLDGKEVFTLLDRLETIQMADLPKDSATDAILTQLIAYVRECGGLHVEDLQ